MFLMEKIALVLGVVALSSGCAYDVREPMAAHSRALAVYMETAAANDKAFSNEQKAEILTAAHGAREAARGFVEEHTEEAMVASSKSFATFLEVVAAAHKALDAQARGDLEKAAHDLHVAARDVLEKK